MTTKIEKVMVKVMGGAEEPRFVYRTTECNGTLGSGIKSEWEMVEVPIEHWERDSEKAILFGDTWLPKSMIESIEWIGDTEKGPFEMRAVRIPRWLAIKHDL